MIFSGTALYFYEVVSPAHIGNSVACSVIIIIVSALLVFAASRNRAMLLVPWLVLMAIAMIGGLIYIIYTLVMAMSWRDAGIATGAAIFVLGMNGCLKIGF